MKKLDIDKDGQISEIELYRVLSSVEQQHERGRPSQLKAIVDQTMKKIASGADDGEDMRSYAKKLIRKFD